MLIQKNRIVADEEIDVNIDAPADDVEIDEIDEADEEVTVDEEATELLFETEDVAELVAEIAGEPVDVTVEDDGSVKFAVGDTEFTVTPEGDEELVESSTKVFGKKHIKASTKQPVRRPAAPKAVKASTSARRASRRAVRK